MQARCSGCCWLSFLRWGSGLWITNGYDHLAYLVFLVPDVAITYWFTLPTLLVLIPSAQVAMATAALWGIICARFGEVLLFGVYDD